VANIVITIRTSFTATHNWPECPFPEVAFLRNEHRHTFQVEMKWPVQHDDRDKEFIMTRREVDQYIRENFSNKNMGRKSCEMIAQELMLRFRACFVSVFEDGENGAEVTA
jgi:hypothetical protein